MTHNPRSNPAKPQSSGPCGRGAEARAFVGQESRWHEEHRGLFEDSRDPIYFGTPGGRFLDVNSAAVELFGYSKQELLDLAVEELFEDASDRERLLSVLHVKGSVKDHELALRDKQGRSLVVLETSTLVRDDAGSVIGMRGILRDVTEHRAMEQRLCHAQRMEAVGQLAGGVAHDFHNLLTAILMCSELALDKPGLPSDLRGYLEETLAAARSATSLTRQLLAFSRKSTPRSAVRNLNRVIGGFENLLRRAAGPGIALAVELDPGLGAVEADVGQIEQILMNLVVNARDAMPKGGHLTLTTSNEHTPSGGTVRLTVRDTGHGMDQETKRRVFDPFFTTKSAGRGTGLGLSTVWAIVRDSGGTIEVESSRGSGTAFVIRLPLVDGPTGSQANWRAAR